MITLTLSKGLLSSLTGHYPMIIWHIFSNELAVSVLPCHVLWDVSAYDFSMVVV